MDFMKQR